MTRLPRSARDLIDDVRRAGPTRVGAVVGLLVAFVLVNAVVLLFWLVVGAVVGAILGAAADRVLRRRQTEELALDLRDHTRDELYAQAREHEIEGRSSMDKDELAEAVAEAQDPSAARPGEQER